MVVSRCQSWDAVTTARIGPFVRPIVREYAWKSKDPLSPTMGPVKTHSDAFQQAA